MKILMFTPFFHPHIGGVETHVKKVSEELMKRGHEVTVVTSKHLPDLQSYESIAEIEVHRFSDEDYGRIIEDKVPFISIKGLSNRVWWYIKLGRLIKKANVIHYHDFYLFTQWYTFFRKFFPHKPVFITFHGYEGYPVPEWALKHRKIAENLTWGCICVGDFIKKWYGTECDYITYGGVERDETGFNGKNEGCVFVGRLEEDSGILEYVDSLKILKEKYGINVSLEICGDGSLKEKIIAIGDNNGLNIKLHGFVDNPRDYLIRSKFAFVSGYLAIFEAMINRKLVFAIYTNELKKDYLTMMPEFSNVVEIVPSAELLADRLVYYHKNPAMAEKKIQRAYDFAKKQTWEKVADIYLMMYKEKGLI
jgi:glycosyltransferase involved in cell wall biosynthesis